MKWRFLAILGFRNKAIEKPFPIIFTGPHIGRLFLAHQNLCDKKDVSFKNRYAGLKSVNIWLKSWILNIFKT